LVYFVTFEILKLCLCVHFSSIAYRQKVNAFDILFADGVVSQVRPIFTS